MAKEIVLKSVSEADVANAAVGYVVSTESALWQAYVVGYGVQFCGVKRAVPMAKGMDKSSITMACAVARNADKDVKFRNKLQRAEFRSLRAAYDECPKSGEGRPTKKVTVSDKAKKMIKEDKKSAVALAKAILAEAGITTL